ncbi:protein Osi13 [Haematobia irritans]|uniref:protein Osi13 n=1 Tax=Haematobia irritans TaxID=7368 RepID=UPI003F500347
MKLVVGFVAITAVVQCKMAKSHENALQYKDQSFANVDKIQDKTVKVNAKAFWPEIQYDENVIMLSEVLEEIENGRGKSHKYKKLSKTLYPLFVGVLIAKVVLIPLMLKMLTAISTAALIMSKISLITTGLLILKWIISGQNSEGQQTQFELIYVPPLKTYGKSYGGLKTWPDQIWSPSSYLPDATSRHHQKYIPINKYGNDGSNYDGKPFL